MRRISLFATLLIGVAACGPSAPPAEAPQPRDAEARAPARLDPPPVHALIGYREQLELSSEQIEALDSIGQQLHTDNQPLMRALGELRAGSRGRAGRDPRAADPVLTSEEGRNTADRIRRNNQEAVEAVATLLSEDQQRRTCELFNERDRRRAPTAGARATPRTQPHRMPPPWSWCEPAADAQQAEDRTA